MKQRISVLFSFIFFTISILHAQPFSVAYQDAEYVDTERADRTVNARIFYPSNQTGEALPVAEGTFPLIVFAHGFVMPYTAYNLYWESFVAEGYVVVMLDTETGISPSHQDYALDMVFLVEKLQAESLLEDSPFYQKLNGLSAVMGHLSQLLARLQIGNCKAPAHISLGHPFNLYGHKPQHLRNGLSV